MSAFGTKRTWRSRSAFGGKSDIGRTRPLYDKLFLVFVWSVPIRTQVRFTPESGHSAAQLRCPLCGRSRHRECPSSVPSLVPEWPQLRPGNLVFARSSAVWCCQAIWQTRAAGRAFMFPHQLIWHLPTFRTVSPIPHNLLGRCPLPV